MELRHVLRNVPSSGYQGTNEEMVNDGISSGLLTCQGNSQFDRIDASERINSLGVVADKHRVNIDSINIGEGKCKKQR